MGEIKKIVTRAPHLPSPSLREIMKALMADFRVELFDIFALAKFMKYDPLRNPNREGAKSWATSAINCALRAENTIELSIIINNHEGGLEDLRQEHPDLYAKVKDAYDRRGWTLTEADRIWNEAIEAALRELIEFRDGARSDRKPFSIWARLNVAIMMFVDPKDIPLMTTELFIEDISALKKDTPDAPQ